MPISRGPLQELDPTQQRRPKEPQNPKSFKYENKENIPLSYLSIDKDFHQKRRLDIPPEKSTPISSIDLVHWDAHLKFNQISPIDWPFNTTPESKHTIFLPTLDLGPVSQSGDDVFDSSQEVSISHPSESTRSIEFGKAVLTPTEDPVAPVKIFIESPETPEDSGFDNFAKLRAGTIEKFKDVQISNRKPFSKEFSSREAVSSIPKKCPVQIFVDSPQSDQTSDVFDSSLEKENVIKIKNPSKARNPTSTGIKLQKMVVPAYKMYQDLPKTSSVSPVHIFMDSPQSDRTDSDVFDSSLEKETVDKIKSSSKAKDTPSTGIKLQKKAVASFKIYQDLPEPSGKSSKQPKGLLKRRNALRERPQNNLKQFLTPRAKSKKLADIKHGVKRGQSVSGNGLLSTPVGKKCIVFDTPLQNKVTVSGLEAMSPPTRKQVQQLGKGQFGSVIVGKYKGKIPFF